MKRQRVDRVTCVIKPSDINTTKGHKFWETFGKIEAEAAALWVVRLCQKRGSWEPFTHEDLKEISGDPYFVIAWMLDSQHPEDGWIIEESGKLYVTHEFVCQVYMHNPAGRPD